MKKKEKQSQIRKYVGYLKDKDGQSVDEIIQQLRQGEVTNKKRSMISKLRLK